MIVYLHSLTRSIVLAVVVFILAPLALSDIPKIISYQGKVTDTGGNSVPDGIYDMQFSIYTHPSAAIDPIWQSGTHNVDVTDGIFSVLLGTIGVTPLDLDFAQDLWLEVTIEGATQSPRQRLASVGYAYMASGLVPGTHVSGSVTTGTNAAFKATNTALSGLSCGIMAVSNSSDGYAGYFEGRGYFSGSVDIGASHPAYKLNVGGGFQHGIHSSTSSNGGVGIHGIVSGSAGSGYGVHGEAYSPSGSGIHGDGGYSGVSGVANSTDGAGVRGWATNTSGVNYGCVFSASESPNGWAGWFNGDVCVVGTLNKQAGSFLIDHPLDPENKLLRHNFVESPENLLIYRGKVELDANGDAVVTLPDYFRALTKEDEATVNLTSIGRPFDTGYDFRADQSSFKVYGTPGRSVAWTVYADRDDPVIRRLARPVEERKSPDNKYCDRGKLLNPTAYGYPEPMGQDYEPDERELQQRHEERARMEEEHRRYEETRAASALESEPMAEASAPLSD